MFYVLKALTGLLPILYTLVFCLYFSLLFGEENKSRKRAARLSLLTLLVIHFLEMLLRGIVLGHCPLVGLFELISCLALALIATHFIIEIVSGEQSPGIPVLALALFFQAIATTFGGYNQEIVDSLRAVPVHLHIFFGICAHAGFFTGLIYALLYLTLYRQIKLHRLNRIWQNLPPLERMHRMNFWAIGIGLSFFTVGIAIGTEEAVLKGLSLNSLLSSGSCWMFFAILFFSGKILKLSGRRFAIGTLIAALIEFVTVFLTEFFHLSNL